MAASCCACTVFPLDEEAVDCACEADEVVLVLLLLLANSQPANRPTPKIMASRSGRAMIAPTRPRRLCGGVGRCGSPEGMLGWWGGVWSCGAWLGGGSSKISVGED